jgi:nickel superoxide dismutase
MKRLITISSLLILVLLSTTSKVFAHCEIPCGIYDDQMRVQMIAEHISTMEKSMNKIMDLEKSGDNANQLTRWIMNKEEHANQLQEIVTQYFMTQRIKPGAEKYADKLALLHQLLLGSMKAKQTLDLTHIENLRDSLAQFEKLYFAPH